jgi:hypothetical protein
MFERGATLEHFDMEAVTNLTSHVIFTAQALWIQFSSDQKERLQKVLFSAMRHFCQGSLSNRGNMLAFQAFKESEGQKMVWRP